MQVKKIECKKYRFLQGPAKHRKERQETMQEVARIINANCNFFSNPNPINSIPDPKTNT